MPLFFFHPFLAEGHRQQSLSAPSRDVLSEGILTLKAILNRSLLLWFSLKRILSCLYQIQICLCKALMENNAVERRLLICYIRNPLCGCWRHLNLPIYGYRLCK